jgi:hypothetical protein
MRRITLGIGVKFKLYGKVFEIIKMYEGDVLTRDISGGVKRMFTEKQLLEHACNENLIFENPKANTKAKREIPFADFPEINMLSQREKDEMDFKFKAIKPLLSIEGNLGPYMYKRQK